MTIEDKLEELGYEQYSKEYIKRYNSYIFQIIDLYQSELDDAYLEINDTINAQQCIDSIQEAFDILQEDLKKLQESGLIIEED